jgi:hypothetical protein
VLRPETPIRNHRSGTIETWHRCQRSLSPVHFEVAQQDTGIQECIDPLIFLVSQRYDFLPTDSADDTCLRVLLSRSVEIDGHKKEIHHLPLQILAPVVDDGAIFAVCQPPLRRLRHDLVRAHRPPLPAPVAVPGDPVPIRLVWRGRVGAGSTTVV